MRTIALVLTLSACAVGTAETAPELDPAATDRSLAEAYERTRILRERMIQLQAELDEVTEELASVSKAVDGHVTVLKAAATDLGEGTCAATREAGSGLATGRRQYQPLLIRKSDDVFGDSEPRTGIHGVDVKVALIDVDLDGTYDVVSLETDLDGDGYSDYIELGGDRDRDGSFDDDALEADLRNEKTAERLCGVTGHL